MSEKHDNRANHPIRCIGTYHKAGTVWMARVFRGIARKLDLPFERIGKDMVVKAPESAAPPIYFQSHSRFPEEIHSWDIKGFRIIRDPRDIIISAAHYHCKSHEKWLHKPLGRFGDRTYSEAIQALPTTREKYLFEMKQAASKTIKRMATSDGETALHTFLEQKFLTVKYEDLIDDRDLQHFSKVCDFLELPHKPASRVFVSKSLFGGAKGKGVHVRSGKREQWRQEFDRELAEAFAKKHQKALEILGYEKDDSWVNDCK